MADFELGKLFHEYDELDGTMKHFEQENYVKLYKKESHTIEAAEKGAQIKTLIQRLNYSEVAFACVHNGKYKPNTKTGVRPNQKTSRIGCAFVIKLRATADGQGLIVTSFVNSHNFPGRNSN